MHPPEWFTSPGAGALLGRGFARGVTITPRKYGTPKHHRGRSRRRKRPVDDKPVYQALGRAWKLASNRSEVPRYMTPDDARHTIIEGINYAAYCETDFSLHDSENRLFGSEHYNSGRPVYEPSPWAEGNFEEKMALLLV